MPIPVIIVSGFLGAGKTSLLHHFISEYHVGSLALLLDDYGTPNLDAKAIRGLCGAMRRTRDTILEIPPISKRSEWISEQLDSLAKENRFDLALIELSGTNSAEGLKLPSKNPPPKILCLIDALDFLRTFCLPQPANQPSELPALQRRQIEDATLLVLNKCDLLQQPERDLCLKTLAAINQHAPMIETAYGEISPEIWRQVISDDAPKILSSPPQTPPLPAANFPSVAYRTHRPFHPERFWSWFNAEHPGLLRVKGLIWLATRNLLVGGISRTRWQNSCGGAGIWWAALPREEWPSDPEALQQMHETWNEPYGDRRQEILLVGEASSLPEIIRELDACLLTDLEFARPPQEWSAFSDPFPQWDIGENPA